MQSQAGRPNHRKTNGHAEAGEEQRLRTREYLTGREIEALMAAATGPRDIATRWIGFIAVWQRVPNCHQVLPICFRFLRGTFRAHYRIHKNSIYSVV
jgi:hypothetical protein